MRQFGMGKYGLSEGGLIDLRHARGKIIPVVFRPPLDVLGLVGEFRVLDLSRTFNFSAVSAFA